ncbi:MAG TPA: BPTI/Kunitz domain-containing protein [Polyangiaceae bacterium]|nr:BPTI/Kunitz domain-containing protein [Polyangiaceae bacterium]
MTFTSPRVAHAALFALFLVGASATSCSSPEPENGTNTNWQCAKDEDCAKKGPLSYCDGASCTDGACEFAPELARSFSTRDVCTAARTWLSCDARGGATELCMSDDPSHCPGDDPGSNCRNACKPSEYVAACGGVGPGNIPAPPAGCRSAGAVPAGIAFYCCPCGPVAADSGAPPPKTDSGAPPPKTDSGILDVVPALCREPQVVGPCEAAMSRYYYDSETRSCAPFTYGGCNGNDNNFMTKGECEAACGLGTGVLCEHCDVDSGACPLTTDCAACPTAEGLATAEDQACTEPGLHCGHDTSSCTCVGAAGASVWKCRIRPL